MRRASTCLAVVGLLVLTVPAIASAIPTMTFKAKAVPIPHEGGTWPNTGNCLGCGAALEFEYGIEGSGYGATAQNPTGGPPPISQINLFLPAGVTIHPAGFGTCSVATLMNIGPSGCPPNSAAAVGNAPMEVTFGTERLPEETELLAFFAPGEGLVFYIVGHSPASLEFIFQGHYEKASAPYGEELITLLGPVETVPGAPLASFRAIHVKLGAAFMEGATQLSYLTLPTQCEVGGLPFKTEVSFGGSGFGIPLEKVIATYKAPCPIASNAHTLAVSLAGSGGGAVTGGGISCPASCSNSYPEGTMVTLTATPAAGSTFSGWSGGGCSGTGTCTVTLNSDQAVSATFTVVSGGGGGGGGAGGSGGTSAGSSSSGQSTGGGSVLGSTTASIGTVQIAALLGQQLIPSGKAAKIAALLKGGVFASSFTALEAGTAVIDWYQVPTGAKLAKSKPKPILVAAGQMLFSTAGTANINVKLTAAGKRLLKHAKSLKLTAKGIFTPTGKAPVVTTKVFALKH